MRSERIQKQLPLRVQPNAFLSGRTGQLFKTQLGNLINFVVYYFDLVLLNLSIYQA